MDLPQRIALVHEWFTPRSVGGAEQVVDVIDQWLVSRGGERAIADYQRSIALGTDNQETFLAVARLQFLRGDREGAFLISIYN